MLECIEINHTTHPKSSVIWLHGLGADGNDFAPVVREFESLGAPPARYVFPHAPMRPVTVNGGYVMRAWYDIVSADLAWQEDESGIRASQAHVEALIGREISRGIEPNRIVLAGFSQGGAIALHTGLRQAHPLAGIIALSTYLPLAHTCAAQRHLASAQVPVLIAHGQYDGIVPFARGAATRDQLKSLGYPVRWYEYPMQHSVCTEEIQDIVVFLKQVLSEPSASCA